MLWTLRLSVYVDIYVVTMQIGQQKAAMFSNKQISWHGGCVWEREYSITANVCTVAVLVTV